VTTTPQHLEPNACGTCRDHAENSRPAEHPECIQRATLLPAPDAPDYEAIGDMTDDQRATLPARFHTPVWEGNATPNAWLCAVCWGDGWVTRWPCETAAKHGGEVFTPEHHAEQARHRMAAELGRVRAELATTQAELTDAEPAVCADCGHLESAHPADEDGDCNASGARVRGCTCTYFIPSWAARPGARHQLHSDLD